VSVLEASGSASSTHQVSGTTAGLNLVLDHTRTVKVRTADRPPPRCLAAAPGWSSGICLQLRPACHSQGSSALGRLAILPLTPLMGKPACLLPIPAPIHRWRLARRWRAAARTFARSRPSCG
jgi:hypothetical protein